MPLRDHHQIVSVDDRLGSTSLPDIERAAAESGMRVLLTCRDRLDPRGMCTRPFTKYFERPAVTHRTEAWDEIPATPDPEEGN